MTTTVAPTEMSGTVSKISQTFTKIIKIITKTADVMHHLAPIRLGESAVFLSSKETGSFG